MENIPSGGRDRFSAGQEIIQLEGTWWFITVNTSLLLDPILSQLKPSPNTHILCTIILILSSYTWISQKVHSPSIFHQELYAYFSCPVCILYVPLIHLGMIILNSGVNRDWPHKIHMCMCTCRFRKHCNTR